MCVIFLLVMPEYEKGGFHLWEYPRSGSKAKDLKERLKVNGYNGQYLSPEPINIKDQVWKKSTVSVEWYILLPVFTYQIVRLMAILDWERIFCKFILWQGSSVDDRWCQLTCNMWCLCIIILCCRMLIWLTFWQAMNLR